MSQEKLFRLSFQNELCRPRIQLVHALWAGKSINVGTVLGNPNEVVQIPLDEFGLVLGPDRYLEVFELQLLFVWLFNGRIKPVLEIGFVTHATLLTPEYGDLIVTSGADSQPVATDNSSASSARRTADTGTGAGVCSGSSS